MKRITEYLLADHQLLDSLLQRACTDVEFDAEVFSRFRAGILRHIAIEEKVLFPAARVAQGGIAINQAHQLRIEHAALTTLLVPAADVAICREIRSILLDHNQREEGAGGAYEECERLIGKAESTALAEKAAHFPQVRVARHLNRPGLRRTAAEALAAAARIKNHDV